jgi:hypothetical protein
LVQQAQQLPAAEVLVPAAAAALQQLLLRLLLLLLLLCNTVSRALHQFGNLSTVSRTLH